MIVYLEFQQERKYMFFQEIINCRKIIKPAIPDQGIIFLKSGITA